MNHKNKTYLLVIIFIVILLSVLSIIKIFATDRQKLYQSETIQQATLLASKPKHYKYIALTFDDGPYGTSTQEILDILKKENASATFFLIGKNVEKYPDLTRKIVANGNVIGNHSYDHSKYLAYMSAEAFQKNIEQAEQAIFISTGLKPKLFRPPYGSSSQSMLTSLATNGYVDVMWNIDPRDWDYKNSPKSLVFEKIVDNAKQNAIIIMHDGRDTKINYPRENTIEALPEIIEKLRSEGYAFVTIDQILKEKPYF